MKFLLPKTNNQAEYIRAISENDIVICVGPAGTGKTSLACSMAIEYLNRGDVKKIILSRPIIESGKGLGFLPGDLTEKVHNYMLPCYDEINKTISVKECMASDLIEVVPVEFARGRNFHDSFIIIDEAQNLTYEQLILMISRFGRNSKMVINGDPEQCDIRDSFLQQMFENLDGIRGVGLVKMNYSDVIRNKIIGPILKRLKNAHLRDQEGEQDCKTQRY